MEQAVEAGARSTVQLERVRSVQILRAVAALAVVALHASVLWRDKTPPGTAFVWENGAAGVDLFFVISGFIILVAGEKMGRAAGGPGAGRFLELRLIRLIPIYWLATILKLGLLMAMPRSAVVNDFPPLWNIVASFLFIPSRNALGEIYPVLVVGWTLSFELLFYGLFAVALARRQDPVRFTVPILLGLVALSVLRAESWPAPTVLISPMLLEFALGMIVGRLFLAGKLPTLPAPVCALILIACAAYLSVGPYDPVWVRAFGFGPAAALCLWSALSLERVCRGPIVAAFVLLGEASYSLYLTHGFALPAVGMIVSRLHLPVPALGPVIIVGSLIVCSIGAIACYLLVEKPLIDRLRRLARDRRAKASLAEAASPI